MCISADAFAEKSGFLCIYIPAKDIGRAVGAGGTNIRALQRYTATKICHVQRLQLIGLRSLHLPLSHTGFFDLYCERN